MQEKFAIISTPFLSILMAILTPLNWLFTQWKKLVERIIKPDKSKGMTEEELIAIVEEAEQDGGIDEQESEIIQNAMDFTEQEAGNILTPRMEITAISTEATKEEVAKIFTETAYSRLPVYQDTIDHIIGVVYHKDFYNHVYNNGKTTEQIMRPVVFVSKTKKIGKLLKELQAKKSHIAVVLDEYGGTLGIVTLEDILEELVGEIWDEHDEVSADIEIKSENECLVSGNALLDSVFEYLNIEDNDELENKTVSMWIMDILGRYPKVGDTLTYHHLKLEIVKVDDYRVEKVKITH
jgi:CBS domain containing-hemolysin-like protein